MTENEASKAIVDAAFKIHTKLGPGLFESVYETVMLFELRSRGLQVRNQVVLPITYESLCVEGAFKIDLLVEEKVIVELKSIDCLIPNYKKQLLTYMKLSGYRLGLLINFNEELIKNGIIRLIRGKLE